MEKDIYTTEERALINGAKALDKMNLVAKLDLLLLELERSVGLMDGLPLPSKQMEGAKNGN